MGCVLLRALIQMGVGSGAEGKGRGVKGGNGGSQPLPLPTGSLLCEDVRFAQQDLHSTNLLLIYALYTMY